MRDSTRLHIVSKISEYFDSSPGLICSPGQLKEIFRTKRDEWKLARLPDFPTAIKFAIENTALRELRLRSQDYGDIVRFVWGECSLYRLALSLKNRSYLSHGAAARLHGLSIGPIDAFFVNAEQSLKPRGSSPSQESINRAFANNQRQSNYVFTLNRNRYVLLNGKNTGRLGVCQFNAPDGTEVEGTDVERTLIDLTVRPAYAGGVSEVLEAYKLAQKRIDMDKLANYLRSLDYVYPYHQAIGFYCERAGYPQGQTDKLKAFGFHFDFYLAHAMNNPILDPNWRIFYPPGLVG